MRLNYKHILFLSLLIGFVSCRSTEPDREVLFELNLCLPAEELAHYAPRRVIGDPGTNEVFALPKYAYIFIMKQVGETWSVWRKEELKLAAEKWERTNYNGILIGRGDDIYQYKENLKFLLANETPKGRIYIICSNKRLTLAPSIASVSTLNDVLNMKFNVAPDSIRENIQNIYSTPYNYEVGGKYYCTYDCSLGNSFSLDLLMYHVAAKVDIKWNVEESKRIDKNTPSNGVRLTYMEARRLFNGYAYCFKPMKNELANLPESGYDITDIVTERDEGLWWEGRTYFYTIPYYVAGEPNYFPLQMVMCTNGVNKAYGYQLTLKQPMDTSDVFVPWLRGNFILTQPLENKSETKTIDE